MKALRERIPALPGCRTWVAVVLGLAVVDPAGAQYPASFTLRHNTGSTALRGDNFQSHNQKIAWTPNGLFRSGDFQSWPNGSDNVVVQRSTDGGVNWSLLHDTGVHRNNLKPATVEADAAGNVYILYPDSGGTRFVKFGPSNNYSSALVNKVTTAAGSASKFASCYDPGRNRIHHATQWGRLLTFDTSGNVTRNQHLITDGGDSRPSYPHLFVDESGVIHYAMTVADVGDDVPYTDIRYLKSLDGGLSWKAMNGTAVSVPAAAAGGSSGATLINYPDEHNYQTWLACMHVKNGKAHFAYKVRNPANPGGAGNPPVITEFVHYMRFDVATGAREIDSSPNGEGWGGSTLEIDDYSASFASDLDDSDGPLYAVGKDGNRLNALVSYDNGQTWQDYARSGWYGTIANPGLARDLTPDGKIIGGVALNTPYWAWVHHLELPANMPPEVDAGPDQSPPARSADLDATVTDDGFTSVTTVWSMVSGPGLASFDDPTAVDTTVVFSAAGAYVLRLTADDGAGPVTDDVEITAGSADPATGFLGECGTAVAEAAGPSDWRHIVLRQTYASPIVVMGPPSANDSDPVVIRVRNTSPASFEFQLDEWDYLDGVHGAETISWLVVEAGDHRLADGTRIKAGSAVVNHNFTGVSFPTPFAVAPAVIAQVVGTREASAVTERLRSVTASGFEVKLDEEEGNDGAHTTETVHWIAIERTSGDSAGQLFEAASTARTITHTPAAVSFSQSFAAAPVFLANSQTYAGEPCALRVTDRTASSATIFLEEETSGDPETDHNAESVGWLALEAGLLTAAEDDFAAWAATNAPGQSMDMDHDDDGAPNGIEFFMGESGSGFTALPVPDATGTVSWPVGPDYPGAYGSDFVVETSTNLVDWNPVPAGEVTLGATIDYTIPGDAPARFARLKVTGP